MRKKLFIIAILLFVCGRLFADEQLAGLISQKQWDSLAAVSADESHKILKTYFKRAQSIRFVIYNINKLTYKAKFPKFAEIGTITYEKENTKYRSLQIKNQINPLFFIEKLRKYPLENVTIKVGEADILLQKGDLYQSSPFGQVLLFKGSWKFYIKPSDEEERLTLMHQTKKEFFSTTNDWGIFILSDRKFIKKLNSAGITGLGDSDIISMLEIYRQYFGIRIKQFNEYWYLPFKQEDNLVIFRKDKKNFYLYDFNGNLNPDTLLRTSPDNKIVISYNSIKSAKLLLQGGDRIDKISLNLFYNPESNFISGTANISFINPSPFKVLNLATGLKIKANLDMESKGLSVVRKGLQYYFLGPATDKFSFFYSGNIEPRIEYNDIFKRQIVKLETTEMDNFFYLSRTLHFYPNTYIDFAESNITISVDKQFDCLATGQKVESTKSARNVYKFFAKNAKGISLVCGDFKFSREINTKVPLKVYSSEFSSKSKQLHLDILNEPTKKYGAGFDRLTNFFDFDKLKDSFNFLLEKYGTLDMQEVNLLFKKGLQEGGISNKGFILYTFNPDISISQKINRDSPILLSSDSTDHLIHELAHQWWGGLLSWKSYQDIWITEGLAQFSVIYYLENRLSDRKFNKILRKMKRWINRKNDSGPVIYGKRIIDIDGDFEAFQSLVYNKAAFIFLMLKDLLGEEEFLKRLKITMDKFKYRSVPSSSFIKHFSEGSKVTAGFFEKWIYSRKIPEATLYYTIKGKKAYLLVEQQESDFIFPLQINIKTEEGSSAVTLAVKKKKYFFDIIESSPIKSIDVNDSRSLVKVSLQRGE